MKTICDIYCYRQMNKTSKWAWFNSHFITEHDNLQLDTAVSQHSEAQQSDLFTIYRKFPKYSDTQKICCNQSKIWTVWLSPNDADGMANNVDPDQTAPLIEVCTVCPGISVRKLRIITIPLPCHSIPRSIWNQSCRRKQVSQTWYEQNKNVLFWFIGWYHCLQKWILLKYILRYSQHNSSFDVQ